LEFSFVFDDEYEDDDADDDGVEILGNKESNLSTRPCLSDLTKIGWKVIENVKVREVRRHASERSERKRDTMKYFMVQVINMKNSTREVSVCEENPMAEFSPWSQYLNEIRPNYYL
jgi:hypothetical protein